MSFYYCFFSKVNIYNIFKYIDILVQTFLNVLTHLSMETHHSSVNIKQRSKKLDIKDYKDVTCPFREHYSSVIS